MGAAVVEPHIVEMQTGQILFVSTVDRGENDRYIVALSYCVIILRLTKLNKLLLTYLLTYLC